MKIEINLTNKWLYSIITLVVLTGFVGFVFAYNSDWQSNPGTPSIMGHSIDEIEGLEDYIADLVEDIMGEGEIEACTNQVYSSVDLDSETFGVSAKPGYSAASLPSSCFDSGCKIIQEIYNKKGIYRVRVYTFRQESSGRWWSSLQTSGKYTNGDTTSTNIVPSFSESNILIRDDLNSVETTQDKITIRDNSGSYGQRVFIC